MRAVSLVERTAYHEVGHCLAALAYGIPIRTVTVEGQPYLERGEIPEGLPLEALLTLICAGPECERLHVGAVDDGGDIFDIRAALRHLRRSLSPLEVLGAYSRARDSAGALVATPWARRTAPRLVRALVERGTLSGEDIAALLLSGDSGR
jgi:hypothetical protein